MDNKNVKVIFILKDEMFRDTLTPDRYTKLSTGQIVLPKNCYSAGWCKRVGGINWEDLPNIKNKEGEYETKRV